MLENVGQKGSRIGMPLTIIFQLRRIRAASNNSRELPSVTMGPLVEDFFDTVLKESKAGKTLPNW